VGAVPPAPLDDGCVVVLRTPEYFSAQSHSRGFGPIAQLHVVEVLRERGIEAFPVPHAALANARPEAEAAGCELLLATYIERVRIRRKKVEFEVSASLLPREGFDSLGQCKAEGEITRERWDTLFPPPDEDDPDEDGETDDSGDADGAVEAATRPDPVEQDFDWLTSLFAECFTALPLPVAQPDPTPPTAPIEPDGCVVLTTAPAPWLAGPPEQALMEALGLRLAGLATRVVPLPTATVRDAAARAREEDCERVLAFAAGAPVMPDGTSEETWLFLRGYEPLTGRPLAGVLATIAPDRTPVDAELLATLLDAMLARLQRRDAPVPEGVELAEFEPPAPLETPPPTYPRELRGAGPRGTVVVRLRIGRYGRVLDAAAVEGKPLLDAAVLAAVRTWRFEPALRDGEPIEVFLLETFDLAP
jgi:TonB family protein